MVSRRKILSRSRDDLNLDQSFSPQEEEEDVWYQKDKLYKEHIQEVLDKWTQIDDEIWAKVIVFERNRRVAKAYARAPVLTINGSDDGFDGMRIGLCGFDNPMRDPKTEELKRHIGQGVKIKMDDAGNILIRRYAKSNVYVKSTASSPNEETSIGADILKLQNQALESEKIVKLFDMKKFQSNVNRELRRAYPDRRRLETQCLSAVAFVKSESDILECPIWVLIVNVVAMDMLKSKLPPAQRPMVDIKNRPRIPIPDEDPYSVAGNGSGGSSGSSGFGAGSSSNNNSSNGHQQSNGNGIGNSNGINLNNGHVAATREQLLLQTQQLAYKRSEKPPKLPPRDNIYSHDIIPKPDYDDIELANREVKLSRGKSDKGKDNKKYDDPYYCGLRARVPNFVKSSKTPKDHKELTPLNSISTNGVSAPLGIIGHNGMNTLSQKKTSMIHHGALHMHPHHAMLHHTANVSPHHHLHHHHQHNQMWQTRNFVENSLGIYDYEPVPQNLLKSGTKYYANGHQRTPTSRPGRPTMIPQQPLHKSKNRQRSHSQMGRHEERIYYDDIMRAKRHAKSKRRDQIGVEYCNCVSCHALAPLFGAVPPTRPPRSLSQQMLTEHRRLSGAGFNEPFERSVKWCSESDISELGRNNDNNDTPYELELQDNLYGKPFDIGDFDMDKPFNIETHFPRRRTGSGDKRKSEPKGARAENEQCRLQPKQHELKTGCTHGKLRHRQRLPEQNGHDNMIKNSQELGTDSNPISYGQAIQKQNRSQSIESFFEQPNEEGSLYMYGGRKRISKAPSTTNLYDRTDTLTTYNSDQCQLYEGTRGLLHLTNRINDSYKNNIDKNNNNNSNNNKNDKNKNESNNDDNNNNKSNAIDNSKPKRTETRTTIQPPPPLPPPCWRSNKNNNRKNSLNNNKNNNNTNNNNSNISKAIARKIEKLQKQKRKEEKTKNDVSKTKLTNDKNNNKNDLIQSNTKKTNNNKAIENALNERKTKHLNQERTKVQDQTPMTTPTQMQQIQHHLQQQQQQQHQNQRQSRPTNRLDISDMESIYGYLKPRKPRSLSLKKIQIHDY